VAVEDALEAGRYEQALKHRPSPFVTQLKLDVVSAVGTVRLGINVPSLLHRALSRLPARRGSRGGDPILSWRMTTDYTPPARLLLPKFRLTSNRKDAPHDQPPNFRLDLRPEQLRSLHWMLQQESDDAPPFLEEEISEAIHHPLGWRIEGKAQRPVHVSGGVLADEVGYGKTAITLGLIDSTQGSLPKRKKSLNEGKIPTNATLVVVPAHLTRQWASEIKKFMGKKYNVVTLETMQHLNKVTVQDILDADIILLASRLVKSDIYLANLQSFAAGDKLPPKEGRYFDAKLQQAHASLREQTKRLKEEGASAVLDVIKGAAGLYSFIHPRSFVHAF
jgi:SNF2 family DNA or RNA helicase